MRMRALAATLALALVASDAVAEPVAPTQALVEKLGQGDRMFLAGDYRSALFAYQDAVYMHPRYAPARVRLGRAYLALRYPAQAIEQAEAALAEEPESADARKLLDEARAAPPKPGPAAADTATPARGAPRVDRLTPEPDPQSASSVAAPVRAPEVIPSPAAPAPAVATALPAPVPAAPATATPAPTSAHPERSAAEGGAESKGTPTAPPPTATATPTPAATPTAADHYREAIAHLKSRDWVRADAALSDAILADPKLAVAYSARGSARFALGKYRDAAEDYQSAVALDPKLATPVYGLAECYRVLGDGRKAAEMYGRYAESSASDVRDDLRAMAAKRAHELK